MLLVALLHVLAYWATPSTITLPIAHEAAAFEWDIVSAPRTVEPIRWIPSDVSLHSSTATTLTPKPLPAPLASPADSPVDHPPDQSATDWNAELELVAKSTASGDESARRREFGFPRRAPPPKIPAFAWDRVHTHRVEIAPEGGMIIHLSDKCVMVFTPLPFALCGIGKKETNGHLLDHMTDDPAAEVPAP